MVEWKHQTLLVQYPRNKNLSNFKLHLRAINYKCSLEHKGRLQFNQVQNSQYVTLTGTAHLFPILNISFPYPVWQSSYPNNFMVSLIPSGRGKPKTQFIFLRLRSSSDNSPSANVPYSHSFIYRWHCVIQIRISQPFIHGETSKKTFHIPKIPYL